MQTKFLPCAALLLALASFTEAATVCGPSGCYPAAAPVPTLAPSSEVRHATRAVVRVRHSTPKGTSIGSATLVSHAGEKSFYVTCAHVFDDGPGETRIRSAAGAALARIVTVDRSHDLALLSTDRAAGDPAPTEERLEGGDLIACGFGSNGVLRCVRGAVTGYATPVGAASPSLRMRGAVRPGDSGGPVFDLRGRLVAIVWGERGGETYATFGAPLRRLLSKLPAARRLTPVERPNPPAQAHPSSDADTDAAWRSKIEKQISAIGQRLSRPAETIPPKQLDQLATRDDLARIAERLKEANQRPVVPSGVPNARVDLIRRFGRLGAKELLLGALGVGGPLGGAILIVRWLAHRSNRNARTDNATQVTRVAGADRPVAVDTPPPPQRVVPETHYVPYERDEYARAHQWASEQLARKFPGSVEWLTGLDSLIRQQLAGSPQRTEERH